MLFRQAREWFDWMIHYSKDTPERLAWGFAIGMFVAWTPTIGFQMIIACLLAWLLGGNPVAAIAIVWVTNPYTAVPIFYGNYRLGLWILGGQPVGWHWFTDLFFPLEPMGWLEYVGYAWGKIFEVFWPMWIGSVVAGLVLAAATYFAFRWMIHRYRALLAVPGATLAPTSASVTDARDRSHA